MSDDGILLRHLEREKQARIEAENIGERKITELYNLNASLEISLKKYKELSRALSEQREKTEAQAHQVNTLNNLIESSIEYSIISIDLEGKILSWNAGAKNNYGYSAREVIGKNYQLLYTPEDIQSGSYIKFLRTALNNGKAEGIFERVKKNGERFLVSVVISLIKDLSDNPSGYLLISRDITKQKQLEEQMRINKELDDQNKSIQEADRLKSEFLSHMSHELRTPLNSIIGFSELLNESELGPINKEQAEALQDILKGARDLLHLINDILDISKIESGKMEFYPKEIYLPDLIKEISNSLHPLYSKKHIQLTNIIDAQVATVYLDPIRFKQVLYNYLSNAIKFTEEEGDIQIRILPETEKTFRLEVEDNGIGIKAKDLPKLFIAFQQLDSSLAKKYKGTGLGLSVTKNLVEAQGGHVGVNSTFGKGSTFYAVLPRHFHVEGGQHG